MPVKSALLLETVVYKLLIITLVTYRLIRQRTGNNISVKKKHTCVFEVFTG